MQALIKQAGHQLELSLLELSSGRTPSAPVSSKFASLFVVREEAARPRHQNKQWHREHWASAAFLFQKSLDFIKSALQTTKLCFNVARRIIALASNSAILTCKSGV